MTLRTAVAATILLASGTVAMAQSTTTTPPAATPPPAASVQPQWHSHQAGEMRASQLIGTSVKNNAGETIGDINEVILSRDGQVAAVVIGVGGFLGIGERQAAVNFKSLRVSHDSSNNTLVTLNVDKNALQAAPEWRWANDGRGGMPGNTTTR